MKKVSKRILAVLLTALMLTSCLQLNVFAAETTSATTSAEVVDDGVVIGNGALLNSVTEATLTTDKNTYGTNDAINVTASVPSTDEYKNAWVSISRADDSTNAAIYWYYVSGKNGNPVDIKTTVKGSGNLTVGNYVVTLYKTSDYSTPIKTVDVTIQPQGAFSSTPFDDGMGNTFSLEKDVFTYGDNITFKATVNEKYTGAWIGLYFFGDEYIHGASHANPNDKTKGYQSYVWVTDVSSNGYTTYQNVDKDIVYGEPTAAGRGGYNDWASEHPIPGAYNLVLFSGGDEVLAVMPFTILADKNYYDENDNTSIYTDKNSYGLGEDIFVTATTDVAQSMWVMLYKTSEDTSFDAESFTGYYYISSDNGATENNGKTLNLKEALNISSLPEGAYSVHIMGYWKDNTKYRATYAFQTFTVEQLKTEKVIYECGEDIKVETYGFANTDTAPWVGLYKLSETEPANYIYWYGVNASDGSRVAGQSVVVQDQNYIAKRDVPKVLPPGEYVLRLFKGSDATWENHVNAKVITVLNTKPHAPKDAAYSVDSKKDGFANGDVAVQIADTDLDVYKGIDVVMYWADDNGRLAGYNSLAPFRDGNAVKISEMVSHTIIPEGATKLHIHTALHGIESDDYFSLDLASNGVIPFDLSGNYSEFTSVTDTHLYFDSTGQYLTENELHNRHFVEMLKDIKNTTPNSKAINIAGDMAEQGGQYYGKRIRYNYDTGAYDSPVEYDGIVQNGEQWIHGVGYVQGTFMTEGVSDTLVSINGTPVLTQYDIFNTIFNKYDDLLDLPPVYVARGNHDTDKSNFMAFAQSIGSLNPNFPLADDTTDANGNLWWTEEYDNSPDYHDRTIDGYRHIFLSGVQGADDGYSVMMGKNQLAWMENILKEEKAKNPNKPVFVYLHQPLENTVSGGSTEQGYHGVYEQQEVQQILSKYNNVIMFNGHTHWELNSANNMHPGDFVTNKDRTDIDGDGNSSEYLTTEHPINVALNAASAGYLWSDYYGCDIGVQGSQGYFVRIYDDKVVMMGRDFVNKAYVPSAVYVLNLYDDKEFAVKDIELNLYADESGATKTTNAPMTGVTHNNLKLTYQSLNKDIVKVDTNTGALTAVGSGKAEIVVSAVADDTHVVTRKYMTVTVRNNMEDCLGSPVNLGDFSAYIKSTTQSATADVKAHRRYLTLASEQISGSDIDSRQTIFKEKYADSTPLDTTKRGAVLDQFWDFELQDDGSYIIYNTKTNASHDNTALGGSGYYRTYALSGGGISYSEDASTYLLCEPTGDVVSLDKEENENFLKGDRADYYKWYIYQDEDGNYYFKCKATGNFANLWPSNSGTGTYFGSMDPFNGLGYGEYKHAFEIEKIAADESIKVNLFDYGSYITDKDDASKVMNFVNTKDDGNFSSSYVDDGVKSQDYSGRNRPEMNLSLDANGYPVAEQLYCANGFEGTKEKTKSNSLQYLFDENMTYVNKDGTTSGGLSYADYIDGEYESVRFDVGDGTSTGLFKKDEATNTYSYRGRENAAYFDTSAYFLEENNYNYVPVYGEKFQLYDYMIRPYSEWYSPEKDGNMNVEVLAEGETPDEANNHTITLGNLSGVTPPAYNDDSVWDENSLMQYRAYAENGEFMPFNLGHAMSPGYTKGDYRAITDTDASESWAKQYGKFIPAYYNDVNVKSDGITDNPKETNNYTNMWFGMNFEFDFQQLNGGTVPNSLTGTDDEMVFKFVGDDDVWVYIDDVLVLDLGGIHSAYYGEINFKDGTAIHPATNINFHYEEYSILDKYINAYIDAKDNNNSALYSKLEALAMNLGKEFVSELTDEEIKDHLIKYNEEDTTGIFDANGIFLDESIHTLKFYYLERGAGVSTCNVSFNMAPIPTAVVDVEKQVVSSTDTTIDLSDRDDDDYSFRINGYQTQQEGDAGIPLYGEEYKYDVVDTKTGELIAANLKVENGEIFTLKGGQRAVFSMQIKTNYTIEEIQGENQKFIPSRRMNGSPLMSVNFVETSEIIEGQEYNIDFINALQPTTVTLKYYDRVITDGQPSDISSTATSFKYDFFGSEVEYDTNDELVNSAELIQKAADRLNLNDMGNVLDNYILYTSNEEAMTDLSNNYFNYHTGENYIETEYHTNHYGYTQDASGNFADGSAGDGEKWVNIDDNNITTWLFNTPKEYTVTTYGVVDDESADALNPIGDGKYVNTSVSTIRTKAYYNQRMGVAPDEEADSDTTNYLTQYGIDGYTDVVATTNESVETFRGTPVNFLYWAFDANGTQIASTDYEYNQRIASDTTLYAVYGETSATVNGLTLRENGYDNYYDESGVNRIRLNAVINPYGVYANKEDTTISDVALLYVNLKNVSDENIATEIQALNTQLENLLNDTNQNTYEITGKTVNLSSVKDTAKVNGFRYSVVSKDQVSDESQVYLTNKNRVQLTTNFKMDQYNETRMVAVGAIRVDGKWIISDNFNDYNPETYLK